MKKIHTEFTKNDVEYYSENEAFKKICPLIYASSNCVGSRCMKWKWVYEKYFDKEFEVINKTDKGCCGL